MLETMRLLTSVRWEGLGSFTAHVFTLNSRDLYSSSLLTGEPRHSLSSTGSAGIRHSRRLVGQEMFVAPLRISLPSLGTKRSLDVEARELKVSRVQHCRHRIHVAVQIIVSRIHTNMCNVHRHESKVICLEHWVNYSLHLFRLDRHFIDLQEKCLERRTALMTQWQRCSEHIAATCTLSFRKGH